MKKILTIMLIVTAFVGCKKGEEDPIISLRSRDARITGTWELKKMEVSVIGTGYSMTQSFDGTTLTQTYTGSGGGISTSKYTSEITFEKNGVSKSKMSSTPITYNGAPAQNQNAIPLIQESTGDWNWVNSDKNKTSITMTNNTYSNYYYYYGSSYYYYGSNNVKKIQRLTNKELIFESNSSYSSIGSSTGSSTIKEVYTYEKKKK